MTREDWLQRAVSSLRPRFAAAGYALPDVVHVSVGLPSKRALSTRNRVVGQCWNGASADGKSHIFISPLLADGVEALDTLAHELVHVVTPKAKHGAKFVKAANAVGLTKGLPTGIEAGPELRAELERLNAECPYPHVALDARSVPKQSTRLVKVECAECGYVARVTRKWLDAAGAPICPIDACAMEEK